MTKTGDELLKQMGLDKDLNPTSRPPADEPASPQEDRMMKWFAFEHLRPPLAEVSAHFYELARMVCSTVEPGPERTVALRKLLEAKDAAVRAKIHPGG